MSSSMFIVSTEKFEGPLDVLLELVQREKLDITQVSLAKIADDFLAYVKSRASEMEPAFLSGFLVVASRLLLIKSRALLPFLKFTEEEEEQMEDLETRLLQYKKFKEAAKQIRMLAEGDRRALSREQFLGVEPVFYPPQNISAGDLEKLMAKIVHDIESLKIVMPEDHVRISVSLQQIIGSLKERVMEVRELLFSEFKRDKSKKIEIILTFLAMLELAKEQIIVARQTHLFGEITLTGAETLPGNES